MVLRIFLRVISILSRELLVISELGDANGPFYVSYHALSDRSESVYVYAFIILASLFQKVAEVISQ